ncbi:hypothetical protein [Amycolatopsis pithecellobii]|uniref:Transposase IS701-like DDE domain-containing protein n=1 Tax=Amycolatopsis pithecellobii TaxID=664692 RepID=A0A6N7ZA23_9PSEU|nr:hypothetical protein [Amycolatopsis pithecellobii]MTD58584.1 hypothetical protein [Amycolatopsis pithecellobii]
MQRLRCRVDWDIDRVRDYVVEHLGLPGGVLIVDDAGVLKTRHPLRRGARTYSGTAGRIENGHIGTLLILSFQA